jgi:hypothetical protein
MVERFFRRSESNVEGPTRGASLVEKIESLKGVATGAIPARGTRNPHQPLGCLRELSRSSFRENKPVIEQSRWTDIRTAKVALDDEVLHVGQTPVLGSARYEESVIWSPPQ